jgi:hypothetical protein
MVWVGKQSEALLDETNALDVEGAFRASKTTICLWKEYNALKAHPGIHTSLWRWTDDATFALLKPVWLKILREAGENVEWNGEQTFYEFENGSKAYMRGLKAAEQTSRYSKFRGLTLSRAYIDQAEEIPRDIYSELKARLSQNGYPHQIVISPNSVDEGHWIAREFPEDNRIRHRKYISLSVYDNAHNLSEETIRNLEETYPPAHAKHRPAVLGLRGLNVIGDPVYGPLEPTKPETAAFQRPRHERVLTLNPHLPLYEAIDFGKHHPCVVWQQYTPYGEKVVLGGILGQNLYLEDFAPIVQQYRQTWFPEALEVLTCCDPAGSHNNSQGVKNNGVKVLQDLGFVPTYKPDSNSPAVRSAMIERNAGYMRRRSPMGEAFGVQQDMHYWLRISPEGVTPFKFVTDALEVGYVWDEHMVSVGSKQIRKPKKDGWYEHGMNCLEYLEHNFGGVQPTLEQAMRHAEQVRQPKRERDDDTAEITRYMKQGGYGAPSARGTRPGRGGY